MPSSTNIYTYHYTYQITNIKLQRHYIGVRSSKIHPFKDIGVVYFSSSIDKDFIANQKQNPYDYEYKILGLFASRRYAMQHEIELHETYDVARNPRFFNRARQTCTGFDWVGHFHTEEYKKKMSEFMKGKSFSEETLKKMSIAASKRMKRILENDGENYKLRLSHSLMNMPIERKNQMRLNQSESQKRRHSNNTPEEKRRISIKQSSTIHGKPKEIKEQIRKNVSEGVKTTWENMSDENFEKRTKNMSLAHKRRSPEAEKERNRKMIETRKKNKELKQLINSNKSI